MYARTNLPESMLRRKSLYRGAVALSMLVALAVAGMAAAQTTDVNMASQPAVTVGTPKPAETPTGTYVAEATGDDVFLRSGPGTNYYQCGKLYKSDRIQVVSTQQGWASILPPPGCFSWIPMQYVSINLDNPTMGIITGDNVRIYAGSDFVEPMHSTSEQVKLFRGDTVKLLGEEKDDYYKIAPPQGAYLWVSTQFIQQVVPAPGQPTPGLSQPVVQTPGQPQPPAVAESELLDAYYAMFNQLKVEHAKPLAEQNYDQLKEKFQEIAKHEGAGKAARYAEFTLKQIERFELAQTVAKEIEIQKQERSKVNARIDEAREERLAQVEDLGRFAVIGKLANSSLYPSVADQAKRYRILDGTGKTICYIGPAATAMGQDLTTLIGKKVGLVGEIQPHEATARAFIKYTQVVPLD